jgi:hypothetical protein
MRLKRIFTRTSVHIPQKSFLFIPVLGLEESTGHVLPLNKHLVSVCYSFDNKEFELMTVRTKCFSSLMFMKLRLGSHISRRTTGGCLKIRPLSPLLWGSHSDTAMISKLTIIWYLNKYASLPRDANWLLTNELIRWYFNYACRAKQLLSQPKSTSTSIT